MNNPVTRRMVDDDPDPTSGAVDAIFRISIYALNFVIQAESWPVFYEYARKSHDQFREPELHNAKCPFCKDQPEVLRRSVGAAVLLLQAYNL